MTAAVIARLDRIARLEHRIKVLREALAGLHKEHVELVQALMQATDPSNWDADGFKGEYFDGQKAARDEFAELTLDYIDSDARNVARAALAEAEAP